MFRDEYLRGTRPSAEGDRKSALAEVFADVKWECPQILAAMMSVSDIYFDRVSQIRMERWIRGRTALVGDAAACVSLLAGEGTVLRWQKRTCLLGRFATAETTTPRRSPAIRRA